MKESPRDGVIPIEPEQEWFIPPAKPDFETEGTAAGQESQKLALSNRET